MRKDVVIVGIKANEGADKTVWMLIMQYMRFTFC